MRKKLEHIWYYYKWYLLAAALVIYVAADFWGDINQTRQPDAVVSIVTVATVSEETVARVRFLVQTCWADRNGDGVCEVEVNVYAYDGQGHSGADPDAYSAAAVHLASEIRAGTTEFFVSDAEDLMEQAERLSRWGIWQDFDALDALDCPELEGFGIYGFPEKQQTVLEALG